MDLSIAKNPGQFLLPALTLLIFMLFLLMFWQFKKKSRRDILRTSNIFSACYLTSIGRIRTNNEDSCLVAGNGDNPPMLFAVADGMGGHEFGEVASDVAVKTLQEEFAHITRGGILDWAEWLQLAMHKANLNVKERSVALKKEGAMGSTMVAALVNEVTAVLANVGDSRAYLVRNGQLHKLTNDHSLVNMMAEKGLIKPEEIYTHPRRNEIMRFLGQSKELKVDLFEFDIFPGDILLLCSDGLWSMVQDPVINNIILHSKSIKDSCRVLIDTANQAGGEDNITVLLALVEGCNT